MATTRTPTTNYFRCMKYKRKFYEADDYLPRDVGDPSKTKVRDPDVDKVKSNLEGPKLTQDTTMTTGYPSGKHEYNVVPTTCAVDTTESIPDKVGVNISSSTETGHETVDSSSVVNQGGPRHGLLNHSLAERQAHDRSMTEQASILQALEAPQSTQEICLTLLNMAFWRPDHQQINNQPGNPTPSHNVLDSRNLIQKNRAVCESGVAGGYPETAPDQPSIKRHCPDLAQWNTTQDTNNHISHVTIGNQETQALPKVILLPLTVTRENNNINNTVNNTVNSIGHDVLPNLITDIGKCPNNDSTSPTYTAVNTPHTQSPVMTGGSNANNFQLTTGDCNLASPCSSAESHMTCQETANLRHLSQIIQNANFVQRSGDKKFDVLPTEHQQHSKTSQPNFNQHMPPTAHVLPMTSVGSSSSFHAPPRRTSLSEDSQISDTDSTLTNISASSCPESRTPRVVDSPDSHVGQPGLKKPAMLFPRPAKGRTLWEVVDTMSRRHKDDYYIGWAAEKILELPPDERPNVFPVTPQLKKELVSKSVLTENKKLAFSFFSKEAWGHVFRHSLRNGLYKTLSDAKRDASQLWRDNCPDYDGSRAVRIRDNDGNIVMKRTRVQSGSEFEYRQNLRKAKVNMVVDQIWAKRTVISEALKSENFEGLIQEMQFEMADYKLPNDKISQIADVVAFAVRKELLTSNLEKLA